MNIWTPQGGFRYLERGADRLAMTEQEIITPAEAGAPISDEDLERWREAKAKFEQETGPPPAPRNIPR